MQLSIEAIIVLVIAIVLLGLGVGFIKNFFGQGSDALLGKFTPLKEECDVTASNPVLPREFHVKKGSVNPMNLCVFNDQQSDVLGGTFEVQGCIGPGIAGTSVAGAHPIEITSLGQDIGRGQSTGYKTTLETAGFVEVGGTYICNLQVKSAPQPGSTATGASVGPVQVTVQVS